MSTKEIIENKSSDIVRFVSNRLSILTSGTEDYITAWKKLQDIAADEVVKVLQPCLPNSQFIIPQSKSTYPDIKVVNNEGEFAIDIKCNESSKNPWFDMARLDTIYEERVNRYKFEWELVIKYDSENKGKFIRAYFLKFREVVGIRSDCRGVKYRPYDGKVRPKDWKDFDNNTIYWRSDEDFHNAINISIVHRWKENIKNVLLPKLTETQKKEFKALFD